MVRNFKNLKIWERSRAFVKDIYMTTNNFPSSEKYGLTSQLNRAVVSIPSNIAEGCGQGTEKSLSHYLDLAMGSSCEAETQLYLAYDLEFIPQQKVEHLTDEIAQIRRMIKGYQNTLTLSK